MICQNSHFSPDKPTLLRPVDYLHTTAESTAERTELDRVYTAGLPSSPLSPLPSLSILEHPGNSHSSTPKWNSHQHPRSQFRALDGRTDHQLHPGSLSFSLPSLRGDFLAAALRADTSERDSKTSGSFSRVTWPRRNIANPTTFPADLVTKRC